MRISSTKRAYQRNASGVLRNVVDLQNEELPLRFSRSFDLSREAVVSGEVCFFVEADANSGLLCRLLGFFAQLDLPAPAMRVDVAGDIMAVEARLANFGDTLMPTVAHKMANLVGVRSVDLHEMNG